MQLLNDRRNNITDDDLGTLFITLIMTEYGVIQKFYSHFNDLVHCMKEHNLYHVEQPHI